MHSVNKTGGGGEASARSRVGQRAPAVGGGVACQRSHWMVAGYYFSETPAVNVSGRCWLVHLFWGEPGADHQGKCTWGSPSFSRFTRPWCVGWKKKARGLFLFFSFANAIVKITPLAALPLAGVWSAKETVKPLHVSWDIESSLLVKVWKCFLDENLRETSLLNVWK